MSIGLMSLVWKIPFPTSTQMLIALKLADYANDDGTSIYPAKSSLAEKARCSEDTVKRTMKAFRECGIIHLIKEGGNGPKSTNVWVLNVGLIRDLADGVLQLKGASDGLEIEEASATKDDENKGCTKGCTMHPLTELRGANPHVRGAPAPRKGGVGAPQPINNHQIEPSSARARVRDTSANAPTLLTIERSIDPDAWDAWERYLEVHNPTELSLWRRFGTMRVPAMRPPSDRKSTSKSI